MSMPHGWMSWNQPWAQDSHRLFTFSVRRRWTTGAAGGGPVALEEAGVPCHWQTFIPDDALPDEGVVVDCRGMGARRDWPQLRGVRGEIARLAAPEIDLRHMLRLLHPRYSVYVVPRAEGKLVVGATSIESDDRSAVSVRGALGLLSSAFSMLPALAEARILEFATQVRPALPDNLPSFQYGRERRLLRINGLYRHGFLLTPTVVEEALVVLSGMGRWSLPGDGLVCAVCTLARATYADCRRRITDVCHRERSPDASAGTSNTRCAVGAALAVNSIRGGPQRRICSAHNLRGVSHQSK